jgi:hypothetical protein
MDSTLTRYVLGNLPPEEMEALDERSIVDPEFAERVRAAEHDLADAYARGELSAQDRMTWERGPGASRDGLEQVRLARALQLREGKPRSGVTRAASTRRWALAAAAVIAVATATVYVLRPGGPSQSTRASAEVRPAPSLPASAPPIASFVTLTLPIPTRKAEEPPLLVIPAGVQQARITLRLEPSEFVRFSLALLDMTTKRVVWRADGLAPESRADGRTLTAEVPTELLQTGRAIFQVTGVTQSGSELVGMYPLTIERKT